MKVLAELVERVLGRLALDCAVVDRTPLHGRRRPRPAQGLAQPRIAVDNRQERRAQPSELQVVDEALPRVAGFAAAQPSASNSLRPSASTATAVSTGTLVTLPALRRRKHTASR